MRNNTANIYTIYKWDAKQIFIGGYQGESYKTHKVISLLKYIGMYAK